VGGPAARQTNGERAERKVEDRIRAALPAGATLHVNVRYIAKPDSARPGHDGEADLVLVHREFGLLVIETKSGTPSRSGDTWFLGTKKLDRSPFRQAEQNKHDLVRALADILAIDQRDLRAGHAVAFPDADLASLPRGHALLGPDVTREIVLDAAALETPEATRKALDQAWSWWTGDGSRGRPLTGHEADTVNEFLAPTATLTRLIKRDVDDGNARLVQASTLQKLVLNQHRATRRLEIVGPAGSGKSLVAVEKARRLARDGWRTLFVCFNQPLATAVRRELADTGETDQTRRPTVTTFHGLCETLGTRAGTLPTKPAGPSLPQDWWDQALPRALDAAIDALPHERFHALVIDEGQDFEPAWLTSLDFLLRDPQEDILWVFHDPGQALYRDDRVADLGLEAIYLAEDYRCPAPVTDLAARFYSGPERPQSVIGEGRAPVIVEAEPGKPTVEAVRRQLHGLIHDQGVRPWDIAVLSGTTATKSEVWRKRGFGNVILWNGAIDDDGRSLGLPADEVPDLPPDDGIVQFETVRRFKGLEKPVVILCELPDESPRLDALLYTGLTRATAHLVVIATPNLSRRLHTIDSA
jgi:hypothetical protein